MSFLRLGHDKNSSISISLQTVVNYYQFEVFLFNYEFSCLSDNLSDPIIFSSVTIKYAVQYNH